MALVGGSNRGRIYPHQRDANMTGTILGHIIATKSGCRVGGSLRLVVVSVCGEWCGEEDLALARRRCIYHINTLVVRASFINSENKVQYSKVSYAINT